MRVNLLLIWEHVWDAWLRKIYHFVSLMLFLDPLADLLTCLDSKVPLRKKSYLERYVAIRVVIASYLLQITFPTFLLERLNTRELLMWREKSIRNTKDLALSDHLLQCDSPITFCDFDILAFDSDKFKLVINEILLINRDKPVLNRTMKSFWLDLFD